MSQPAEKAPRPPNPKCTECQHPRSFHPTKQTDRKCSAFGCQCTGFALPETETA